MREINFGIREGHHKSLSTDEVKALISARDQVHIDSIKDHAETPVEIYQRQEEFLQLLLNTLQNEAEKERERFYIPKLLCVSHGGFIKSFLKHYLNIDIKAINNCSITVVDITWSVVGSVYEKSFKLLDMDHTSHLVDLDLANVHYYQWPTEEH